MNAVHSTALPLSLMVFVFTEVTIYLLEALERKIQLIPFLRGKQKYKPHSSPRQLSVPFLYRTSQSSWLDYFPSTRHNAIYIQVGEVMEGVQGSEIWNRKSLKQWSCWRWRWWLIRGWTTRRRRRRRRNGWRGVEEVEIEAVKSIPANPGRAKLTEL